MTRLDVDVAIAGSGFSGSILAAILQRHGLKVALIDHASHPRFAIGESSTPTANLILRDLADRYGLSWLRPLSQHGTWKQTYPHLTNGIKRGFAYFWHEPDYDFVPSAKHKNELLVAASSSDAISDTQWLRSDVDAFLFEQACSEGVTPFESTIIDTLTARSPGWKLACRSPEGPFDIHCRFLVDGTGAGGLLSQQLQIADDSEQLKTKSRAVFGHFDNLPRWSSLLESRADGATADHPFDCDHSALHHLLAGGWMWWLRFDNDLTSVGVVLDDSVAQRADGDDFTAAIERFPDLKQALSSAEFVTPATGPVRTGRMQRLASRIADADWAMLPHAAGFI
ncbi:MAG: NAD(P)/FAD-dependent oxidoreductase, partial [Planctomycetota bacterium]